MKNHRNLKSPLFFVLICFLLPVIIEAQVYEKTYQNLAHQYNYTFWNNNFKTTNVPAREFTIQTSDYNLKVDYTSMTIRNFELNLDTLSSEQALEKSDAELFPVANTGDIQYRILQNNSVLHEKAASPTNQGIKITQMAEFGTWLNKRVIDSLNFTNNPSIYGTYSGVEFTSWHNRIKMTLYIRPRTTIMNGQLELAIDMPSLYNTVHSTGQIYGFADLLDQGFAVKGGSTSDSTLVNGGRITTRSTMQDLVAGSIYEVSLIFYPVKEDLSTNFTTAFDDGNNFNITPYQTLPNTNTNATVSYSQDEGLYYIDVPRYTMGQYNCSTADLLQNIQLDIQNTTSSDQRIRMCFRQLPSINVTGFSSMFRTRSGDPLGIPIQISKNWHGGVPMLHSGSWIREYTELVIPANSTEQLDYTRVGAKWGETYGAFSHQLSVVGAGVSRAGWLEAGLGSFGESVTHSVDYEYGNSNVCDFRPFLVTNQNQGGTSQECRWTGNLGGIDFWVYEDNSNVRKYQSQVKTQFKRYGPNLSETSVSAYSSDLKLKLDYTFYLNRSNDMTRVYYKVKIKALQDVDFNRFDLFQFGSDKYHLLSSQSVVYGDNTGALDTLTPINSGVNDYTSANYYALNGNQPWIWMDGENVFDPVGHNLHVHANGGIVVRSYNGVFGGQANNTPYLRERSHSTGFGSVGNPTAYSLVPPPGTTGFLSGDSIEMTLEVCLLPKSKDDYYGENSLFIQTLDSFGNSWEPLFIEAKYNHVYDSSGASVVTQGYPLRVETVQNSALVHLTNGKNYVPIVFTGMDSILNPILWKKDKNCWEMIDQSNWGKDFWQTDYNPNTGLFDLIYNVNHDAGDSTTTTTYYLGNTPPVTESTDTLIACDSLLWIDGNQYTSSNTTAMHLLSDAVGCDSLVKLDLTINYSSSQVDSIITCDSIVWIDGNNYTASNNSATYTLTDMGGCDSVINLNLVVDNVINLSVIDNSPTLFANATGVNYQWIDCDDNSLIVGETNSTFVASSNGNYGVIIDNGNCSDTSACFLIHIVGIEALEKEQMVQILPNPTTGNLQVFFEKSMQGNLSIVTVEGKVIQEQAFENTTTLNVDLTAYPAGVYLLKIRTDELEIIKKVVKEG